ncbi:Avr9 Cf-9 rapidly elicited protein 146 [Musa troglodytarum]|uniref:Avr9 Cf-9 rapidly elicited protein 146 n=2 Tax=Musa troglodytarum TaxID=320322 RepID=A0A9E7L9S2_9LILI|nr:Avr9 Cf-9 rapidly elicited protein 146 [Musa troglodytarum]
MITAAYYMLRKGFTKHRLMMDLHLLLKRGKLAGKAVGNFVAFHHHRDRRIGANMYSAFSSRHVDTDLSYYDPKEVEFSCSNTPSYPRRNRHRHDRYDFDFAADDKEIEMLNSEVFDAESSSVVASPSPAPMWGFGKSPAAVRQLRITDSPFPTRDEDAEADGRVDQEAEEFIRRFYEQLRLQRSVPTTPECHCHRRRSPA